MGTPPPVRPSMPHSDSSSLSIFQLCLLLGVLLGPAGSIQCYCDELPGVPSPECLIPHEFRCNSSRGCYIRRWYSELHGRIQQSWGCIQGQHGTEAQFDLWRVYCGALNTDNDVYKCCNSSNLCNKHLNITLQTEQQGTALSPSPSLVLTEPRRGDSTNLKTAIGVSLSLIALLILLLVLLSLFLILQRRRRLTTRDTLNHHSTTKTTAHWTGHSRVVLSNTGTEGESQPYQVLSDIRDIVKLHYQMEFTDQEIREHFPGCAITATTRDVYVRAIRKKTKKPLSHWQSLISPTARVSAKIILHHKPREQEETIHRGIYSLSDDQPHYEPGGPSSLSGPSPPSSTPPTRDAQEEEEILLLTSPFTTDLASFTS